MPYVDSLTGKAWLLSGADAERTYKTLCGSTDGFTSRNCGVSVAQAAAAGLRENPRNQKPRLMPNSSAILTRSGNLLALILAISLWR
jgi:hypothetical protein